MIAGEQLCSWAWRKVLDSDDVGSFEKAALRHLRFDARHLQDVQQKSQPLVLICSSVTPLGSSETVRH